MFVILTKKESHISIEILHSAGSVQNDRGPLSVVCHSDEERILSSDSGILIPQAAFRMTRSALLAMFAILMNEGFVVV